MAIASGRSLQLPVRESSTSLRLGSRPVPTMRRKIRQVYAHSVSDFSQADSRLRLQFPLRQTDPYDLSAVVQSVSTGNVVRGVLALSCGGRQRWLFIRPKTRALNVRACRPRPSSQVKPGAKLMKFRPLHDRVVVRRLKERTRRRAASLFRHVKGKAAGGGGHRRWPGARDESGKWPLSNSKRATGCCLASGPVPRSRSTARNF